MAMKMNSRTQRVPGRARPLGLLEHAHARAQDEAPYLWKWREVYPCLMDARESVGLELAERRAIRLVNPQNPTRATSRTLLFTFSVVNPGEIAGRTATTWRPSASW